MRGKVTRSGVRANARRGGAPERACLAADRGINRAVLVRPVAHASSLRHLHGPVEHLACVPPLVVMPSDHLHEGRMEQEARLRIEDGVARCAAQLGDLKNHRAGRESRSAVTAPVRRPLKASRTGTA